MAPAYSCLDLYGGYPIGIYPGLSLSVPLCAPALYRLISSQLDSL